MKKFNWKYIISGSNVQSIIISFAALAIFGGVFVHEALSVIMQVTSFKLTGKRIFKMAPIHHHFELCGFTEIQIVKGFAFMSLIFAILSVVLYIILL